MKTQKNLILCLSEKQVDRVIQEYGSKLSGSDIISFNPETTWALQNLKIDFISVEKIQKNKPSDQIESLQAEQIKWAKKLDLFLQERNPDFKSGHFNPTQYYLFYLKNSWDTFINRADLLEQISFDEAPEKITFFCNPYPLRYNSSLEVSGSVLSECIPLWSEAHGITAVALPAVANDAFWGEEVQIKPSLQRKIISSLPQSFVHQIQSLLRNSVSFRFPSSISVSEKMEDVIVRNSYDFNDEVNCQLRNNGLNPRSFEMAISRTQRYPPSPSILQFLSTAWNEVIELDWFWKPGGWQKWSLRPGLETLFYHYWFICIPELWDSYNQSKKYLVAEHPNGVCTPLIWGPRETGFVMAAHNENIPVVFYQHGANLGDIEHTSWDIAETIYSDFLLVYGEGGAEYHRSRHVPSWSRAVAVPVGSARLDQVSRGISDKKILALRRHILQKKEMPLILYVPGIFYNNFFRYSYQDYRDCRTFSLRYNIAKIFNNHPEVHFSYKAFFSSGHDPTLEMLKKVCPKCSVIDSVPLTELQWAADILIYEVPSTGMFEGLVSNKPMIVHVDRDIFRMPNMAKELLRKRVTLTETSGDLIEVINNSLELHNFVSIDNLNREFIKSFCTDQDDGQSAKRAADAVANIIKQGCAHHNPLTLR